MERLCGEDMKVENEALGGWGGVFVCPGISLSDGRRSDLKGDELRGYDKY